MLGLALCLFLSQPREMDLPSLGYSVYWKRTTEQPAPILHHRWIYTDLGQDIRNRGIGRDMGWALFRLNSAPKELRRTDSEPWGTLVPKELDE
jgi:hypothetical protein